MSALSPGLKTEEKKGSFSREPSFRPHPSHQQCVWGGCEHTAVGGRAGDPFLQDLTTPPVAIGLPNEQGISQVVFYGSMSSE